MNLSNEGRFRRAVRTAIIAGAACSAASVGDVLAQEAAVAAEGSTELEKIEVTGSRIRRIEFETASPVFVIDRTAIESSGVATVGQLLQEMPTIAGAATNPQVNNGGGSGAATVSLRGLGSARTLVLLNGKRLVDSPATDVNAIPINMIERVEILKDGASAIYGSDAVGGVVNFITRRQYEGMEVVAGHGVSSRDDGALTNYWITAGTQSSKGALQMGMNLDDRSAISSSDRDFSKDPFALYYGQKIVLGSSRSFPGRYRLPASVDNSLMLYDCDGDANFNEAVTVTRIDGTDGRQPTDYRCFISGGPGNDTYDFQDVNVTLTPQERYGAFLQGDYKVSDGVAFYAETMYHKTSANFQIAPEPFDGRPSQANVPITDTNVYNPFGVTLTDVRLRLVPVGNREEQFNSDRFQATFGFKGGFPDMAPALSAFRWDVYGTFGRLEQTSEAHGEIYTPALTAALGPSFDAADNDPTADADGDGNPIDDPQCGTFPTPIAGCVPVDFFGVPSGAALSLIAPYVHDRTDQRMSSYAASITGDVAQLPAGPVGLAAGYEYREESLDFQPDFLRQAALISGNSSSPIFGEFDVSDLYAEASVPLLADLPGVERLTLSLGVRRSDYSTFGGTTNGKYGLEYRPYKDLLVRATYADVFRAPTISNLFSGNFESADTFTDPCNGLSVPVGVDPNIDAACQNVPRDGSFAQTDSQLNAIVGGNPDLQPEEGNTLTFGVVFNPSFFAPLSVTVDYWSYELERNIGSVGAAIRLQQCFNSGLFCDSIFRDATGEVSQVNDQTDNVGKLTTKGIDTGIRLQFPGTAFGRFSYNLDTTYLIEYDNERLAGDPSTILSSAGRFVEQSAGGDGHFARVRALSNLNWQMADWEATLGNRYIHSVTEGNQQFGIDGGTGTYNFFNGTNLTCAEVNQQTAPAPFAPVVCERKIAAQLINDISVSYSVRPLNTKLTLGIDNVTDEIAPLIYTGFNGTTDVRTYDTIGRFFWLRVKYSL